MLLRSKVASKGTAFARPSTVKRVIRVGLPRLSFLHVSPRSTDEVELDKLQALSCFVSNRMPKRQ